MIPIESYQKHWIANTALLLITFIWGATFTLTKGALSSVSVFPFLFIRFLLAALVLLAIALINPISRRAFHARTYWIGSLLGILLFGAYAFQTLGLQETSPAVAGFLTGLNVVLVPIFSIPLFRKFPHGRTWIGVIVAVAGLALISGTDLLQLHIGDIQVLICAVFVALQIIYTEKYGAAIDSLALATVEIFVVTLLSLFFSFFRDMKTILDVHLWLQPTVFWAVLINAVLGTSLAYWGQNKFQQRTSSVQIALIFSMEPVFAALIAWLYFGEMLTGTKVAGGVLIFLSMLVAEPSLPLTPWKSKRKIMID